MGGKRFGFMVVGIAAVACMAAFYRSPEYPRTMSYLASSTWMEKVNDANMRFSEFRNTTLAPYISRIHAQTWELSSILREKVSKLCENVWAPHLPKTAAAMRKALSTTQIQLSPLWRRCISATYMEKKIGVAAILMALVCILLLRRRKASTKLLVPTVPAEMVQPEIIHPHIFQPEPVGVLPDPNVLAERTATLRHRTKSPAPISRVHDENVPAVANSSPFFEHLSLVNEEDMKSIPGLGEKSIQKLTKYRRSVGAFTKWEDLRTAGVHPGVIANLQKGTWQTVTH